MASSRKRRLADPTLALARFVEEHGLAGRRLLVGLSGGLDSIVLLHLLKAHGGLHVAALHVHHGLSANADAWARFCRRLCRSWEVPLRVRRVEVSRAGKGVEAAAREARYAAFRDARVDAVLLAHHLDDQAETVLMNLLRGSGVAGARGMAPVARLGDKALLRPLLDVPRDELARYARMHSLEWIEDESNEDETFTRNFVRRRLGPLIATRFPRWRESLARAARHFSAAELDAKALLRDFLAAHGMRSPSEAKLVEMLKQLTAGGARTLIEHDGMRLRVYRGRLEVAPAARAAGAFQPLRWKGERRFAVRALGGELRFRSARGAGIDPGRIGAQGLEVRLRRGGERLQPDPRRPRRTLKNLFQEAGVPPWERERLPMLYRGRELVWAPRLGVDAAYQARGSARGLIPQWHPRR